MKVFMFDKDRNLSEKLPAFNPPAILTATAPYTTIRLRG